MFVVRVLWFWVMDQMQMHEHTNGLSNSAMSENVSNVRCCATDMMRGKLPTGMMDAMYLKMMAIEQKLDAIALSLSRANEQKKECFVVHLKFFFECLNSSNR